MEHVLKTMIKIQQESGNKEVIMGMDHDNYVLKCHLHLGTQEFLSSMLGNNLMPTITRPTRITQTTANLIDNVFVTGNLHQNVDSLILLNDMSDHLPSLILLKQTKLKDKRPIIFESQMLNDCKIKQIKESLLKVDWSGELNSKICDTNFNKFNEIVQRTMNKIAPLRTIRVSGKHRFGEPWMTKGIETSARKKQKLYKESVRLVQLKRLSRNMKITRTITTS